GDNVRHAASRGWLGEYSVIGLRNARIVRCVYFSECARRILTREIRDVCSQNSILGKAGSVYLARWGVLGFEGSKLLFPGERGRLQKAHAAVPAQDGVIIANGADLV